MDSALPVHSTAFRVRRVLNWFPLGLAYAFLYMGRYNLTVAKNALGELMTKADFGTIFAVGAWVYGLSFIINGPLTDRIGGRRTMLIGMAGSLVANVAMGLVLYGQASWGWNVSTFWAFTVLYGLNMYFQSFGAVAIVTTKAPWFHVRERGSFSTIFGVMIALGVYFAFDWGEAIVKATRATLPEELGVVSLVVRAVFGVGGAGTDQNWWVFFVPAIILGVLWVVLFAFLRNSPAEAGYKNFDTGEASVSDAGERLPINVIFFKIISHPVLLIICMIEFCSGILRNGVMSWYPIFAKETGLSTFYVPANWGLMLCVAGIAGAVLTGWASDKFFQSRRAPMAGLLYLAMFASALVMCFSLTANPWVVGGSVLMISMAVIGVHGILSGTSTVDFGGSKNAGSAVGIVDGLVYLGTGLQSLIISQITPVGAAQKIPENWSNWPVFLVPFGLIGFMLTLKIWNALPRGKKAAVQKAPEVAAARAVGQDSAA